MTTAPHEQIDPSDPTRVKGFDGLRAVCALLVFFEHKVRDLGTGVVGVWIFFCLSGYLIVGILHRARRNLELTSPAGAFGRTLLDFWRNRALRILPIYYLVVFSAFALTHAENSAAFPFYALYVQNFYIAWVSHQWSAIGHLWSLAIEQQFYVLAAPVLLLVGSKSHVRLLFGVLCACLSVTLFGEFVGSDAMALSLMPPTNFAFMAVGAIACLVSSDSRARDVLTGTACLLLSTVAFGSAFAATRPAYDSFGGTPLVVYVFGLAFAGVVVAWTARNQEGRAVRFLEMLPLRWLGTISYGFYVYHPLIPDRRRVAHWTGAAWIETIPRFAWTGLELVAACALAHASWRLFERRFLSYKRGASGAEPAPRGSV